MKAELKLRATTLPRLRTSVRYRLEEAAERFEFGSAQIYGDLQALLAATDFAYIRNVLLPLYLS